VAEALREARPAPWSNAERMAETAGRLDQLADEILARCRGEGPANCVGQCPLYVDAREYVQLTKDGRFREALQKVRERLPFPGILGYICAHPCELHCKRIDEDAPIRVRDIKRFLAEWEPGDPQHILDCEPSRGAAVAVVGAGPAGLLAAHDLRRHGYLVTVFEKESTIGGCLTHKIPEWRLPRRVVERDLSIVASLGIEVHTGVEVGRDVDLRELRQSFQAVLVLVGADGARSLLGRATEGLRSGVSGAVWIDPLTGATGVPGVFAGGDAVTGPGTVIHALALGRRAAESVRLYLEDLPMTVDRGSVLPPKPLWTLDVSGEERERRNRPPLMLEPPPAPLTEAEARAEAERCLACECGLCVDDCEFLASYCGSPKEIARRVRANLGDADTLKMVFSCNICSLCRQVCPEQLDTGEFLLEARRVAVRRGLAPLPGHRGVVSYFNAGISRAFTLVMPAPGYRRAKRLFFTGCALPSTSPRATMDIYRALRAEYPSTGVLQWCCGAPVDLIGMEELFEENKRKLLREVEALGTEELITACPDCTHTLKQRVPEVQVRMVWELLANTWELPRRRDGAVVSIHDSCKARHEPGVHAAVRHLLERSGAHFEDVTYAGEMARCCGFGGMVTAVDSELSKRVGRRRGAESKHPMITYCAGCRMALAGTGKPSIHLADFLLARNWSAVARKKAPAGPIRYLNRLRAKWALSHLGPLEGE
jgi:glutamate synthase (NADPH/NADH) small chain